jgi:hypothetical protein
MIATEKIFPHRPAARKDRTKANGRGYSVFKNTVAVLFLPLGLESCRLGTGKIESPMAIPKGQGSRERTESTPTEISRWRKPPIGDKKTSRPEGTVEFFPATELWKTL